MLVAAAMIVPSAFVATPSASATTLGPFSCGVLAPGSWCIYPVRHSYSFAEALYPGSASDHILVCQKTIYDATGDDYEETCGYTETDATFAPFSYLKPLAGNFSNNNHTAVGYAAF
jgi:hypothetical protein